MEPAATPPSDEPIVCHVTPWYYRRMGILTGMLVLMGLYFLYDGKFGYPAKNEIAAKKEWFDEVHLKSFEAAKAAGTLETWISEASAQKLPTGKNGEPPRWVSYAAEKGWPEKPHKYTDREITEQFWWGGATVLAGLMVGLTLLLNRHKTLRAEADHWITPEGKIVRFVDAFRVDKRKWDNKGLAYVWYRPGGEGKELKTIIDDLKYEGAVQVLNRLLAHFKGELIEKIPDPVDPAGEDDAQAA